MHHMSRRHGFRSFSARRRRTVQRDRPVGGLVQAVATSSASSLPLSLRAAPGRGSSLSAPSRLPSTKRRLVRHTDRKSTRLNSSHGYISYAVFCLKKKKKKNKVMNIKKKKKNKKKKKKKKNKT